MLGSATGMDWVCDDMRMSINLKDLAAQTMRTDLHLHIGKVHPLILVWVL